MDDFEFVTKNVPNVFMRFIHTHPIISVAASVIIGALIGTWLAP